MKYLEILFLTKPSISSKLKLHKNEKSQKSINTNSEMSLNCKIMLQVLQCECEHIVHTSIRHEVPECYESIH